MRLPFFAAALLACGIAHAERATERYAPAQLSVARDLLDRARAAAALEELGSATNFAQEAEVDARIAWGMTDAPSLRAEAAQVAAQADAILHPPAQRLSATASPSVSLR